MYVKTLGGIWWDTNYTDIHLCVKTSKNRTGSNASSLIADFLGGAKFPHFQPVTMAIPDSAQLNAFPDSAQLSACPDSAQLNAFPDSAQLNAFPDSTRLVTHFYLFLIMILQNMCGDSKKK